MPNRQLGLLDLIPVSEGMSTGEALNATIHTAQAAEKSGWDRVWLAEHHNTRAMASSATALMMGQVAAATDSIHVGAGGIMLPNHSPLHVAEEFGTLDALFPGRIELGLGRAPGTDPATARELRRSGSDVSDFEHDLAQLRGYLGPNPGRIKANPGQNSHIPFYLLGSSEAGAGVAARAGLPFVFASHFAPFRMMQALDVYRTNFVPNAHAESTSGRSIEKPQVWIGVNIMVADTEEEAKRLFTTHEQAFYGIVTGRRGLLPPPKEIREGNPVAWAKVDASLQVKAVGTPEQVKEQLNAIAKATGADGIIASMFAFDPADRIHAVELLGEAWNE